nr:helix-turn-helix transcriptional regulator [Prevotella sp.]
IVHAKLRKKQYSKAKNQEKSQKLIIFYKKNNILYLFLRNLDFLVNFAGKVQYNTLLGMKIQEVMKLQRKALRITQQDLADMSEIAISTIKKIESGKGNPSLSTVEKIMDILGMEVKYEIRQTV